MGSLATGTNPRALGTNPRNFPSPAVTPANPDGLCNVRTRAGSPCRWPADTCPVTAHRESILYAGEYARLNTDALAYRSLNASRLELRGHNPRVRNPRWPGKQPLP